MVNNDICREQIIQLLVTMSNAILRSDEANLVSEMKTEEVNQIIAKRLSRRWPACMINADVQIGPQAAGPGIEPSVPMVGTYPAAPGAGDRSRTAQLGPWADPASVPLSSPHVYVEFTTSLSLLLKIAVNLLPTILWSYYPFSLLLLGGPPAESSYLVIQSRKENAFLPLSCCECPLGPAHPSFFLTGLSSPPLLPALGCSRMTQVQAGAIPQVLASVPIILLGQHISQDRSDWVLTPGSMTSNTEAWKKQTVRRTSAELDPSGGSDVNAPSREAMTVHSL